MRKRNKILTKETCKVVCRIIKSRQRKKIRVQRTSMTDEQFDKAISHL